MSIEGTEIEADVAECLRDVMDPEIGLNVVDLGLVYAAKRTPGAIEVRLTLTSRACPMGELVVDQVRERLVGAFPGIDPHVDLVWSQTWTPDLITDRGSELMCRQRTRTLI